MKPKTARQAEATDTREAVRDKFRIDSKDAKLYGTADWYVVCTDRGTIKQMRECDIANDPKVVGVLAGPYWTKGQAKDESYGYSPKDRFDK